MLAGLVVIFPVGKNFGGKEVCNIIGCKDGVKKDFGARFVRIGLSAFEQAVFIGPVEYDF